MVEETGKEFAKRLEDAEWTKKQDEARQFETYLALKKKFEPNTEI